MNVTENKFHLVEITYDETTIFFKIALTADEKTKAIYFGNYFQGLYIGNKKPEYNVYTKIKEDVIIGELLYESFLNLVSDKQENVQKLWVRNRIGNTYIDNLVTISLDETVLSWGYRDTFLFNPVNVQSFSIAKYDYKKEVFMENPFENQKIIQKIDNVRFEINKKEVSFCGEFLQDLEEGNPCNELCLVWKDEKDKKKYYFHTEKIVDEIINYRLSFEEMNQFCKVVTGKKSFTWIMEDSYKKEYPLYLSGTMQLENVHLPVSDFYAKINVSKDNMVQVDINTNFFFEYVSNTENGDGIILKYKKRTYELEIVDILVQKVNTQLEYSLPFSNLYEEENGIFYTIPMVFDEKQEDFKKGIYQFWVMVKNGHNIEKIPLKLFRENEILENAYLVSANPYGVVDGYYYDCLFYNDTVGNLKCNIVPKVMGIQIQDVKFVHNEVALLFSWKKEPYLNNIKSVSLISDSGNFVEMKLEKKALFTINAKAILDKFLQELDEIFDLEIQFENNDAKLRIENNYFRPAISGREIMSFSEIKKIESGVYRRIWGNHIGGFYRIGISENLCLFYAVDAWLYENENLCIKLDVVSETYNELCQEQEIKVYLKDRLSDEIFIFDREQAVPEEFIYRIHLKNVELKNYLVYAELSNGMRSYLEMKFSPKTLVSSLLRTKVFVKKEQNFLYIGLEELLLWEDVEANQWCNEEIQKAKRDAEAENAKNIWLIGENYGLSARDNGLAFFEYCMKVIDDIDAQVYFVTKERNQDIHMLDLYKDHVLMYDSPEHLYYDELAEFYIVSHGIRDVMPSFYHNKVGQYRKPVIYLQHGITAMKIIGMSNTSYGGSIRKFIVCSDKEAQLLVKNRQFWEDELVVTGFARYDKLDLDSQKNGEYIWIMPTWRDWLVKSEENFLDTDFYKNYSLILENAELIKLLKKKKQKIVFSLHVEFQKYKHFFEKYENEVIHITDMHEKSITDRMKECSMIVTDYSSVVFDVIYLRKPCLFFQFDQEIYQKYRGSYIDLETDLPGDVLHEPAEFLAALKKIINNHFIISQKQKEKESNYFTFHDRKNCQRIYDEIINCRQEMKDEY